MAIPAYLWLKDDGDADIKGSVDVQDREGSIEILSFGHGLHIPTDNTTGKLTGTRQHSPLTIEKEFSRGLKEEHSGCIRLGRRGLAKGV